MFIRDLEAGQPVDSVFLVSQRSLHRKKNGEDFLRLTLRDCTGTLSAVCWEDAGSLHDVAVSGVAVRVTGRYEVSDRWGPQLTVQSLAVQSTSLDDVFVHYTGRALRDAVQDPAPSDQPFMMRR